MQLVRHAETTWNATGRIQGQADPPLSERGREQCARLGARLRGARIAAVYSSDLVRAMDTARAIVGDGSDAVIPTPGLREVSVGEWEGYTRERLEREWPERYRAWRDRPSWDLVPGGEGLQPFVDRVEATMAEILARHEPGDDGGVVLVTHIGVIRLLLSMAFGIAADDTRWRWAVGNTSITSINAPAEFARWEAGELEVLAINDTAHLDDVATPATP